MIIIGIAAAAHQSWSANIFTTVSDMFFEHAVGTITKMAVWPAVGSFFINKSSVLFDHAANTVTYVALYRGYAGLNQANVSSSSLCHRLICLMSIMKSLVPKYQLITDM